MTDQPNITSTVGERRPSRQSAHVRRFMRLTAYPLSIVAPRNRLSAYTFRTIVNVGMTAGGSARIDHVPVRDAHRMRRVIGEWVADQAGAGHADHALPARERVRRLLDRDPPPARLPAGTPHRPPGVLAGVPLRARAPVPGRARRSRRRLPLAARPGLPRRGHRGRRRLGGRPPGARPLRRAPPARPRNAGRPGPDVAVGRRVLQDRGGRRPTGPGPGLRAPRREAAAAPLHPRRRLRATPASTSSRRRARTCHRCSSRPVAAR